MTKPTDTIVTLTTDRTHQSVDVPATQSGRYRYIKMSDYLAAKASIKLGVDDLLSVPAGVGVLA